MKPINDPDITNTSKIYWEMVLRSHGLSPRKGSQPRKTLNQGTPEETQQNLLSFVGNSDDCENKDNEQHMKSLGKVTKRGHGPTPYEVVPKEDF